MIIDAHVHPWTADYIRKNPPLLTAIQFFRQPIESLPRSFDDLLSDMDEAGVNRAILLGQGTSPPPKQEFQSYTLSNDELARMVDKAPNRFIGFAGVDPHSKQVALRELEHAANNLGLKGLKIHPNASSIYPNDPELMYPIYSKCVELNLPVLHHTGTTGLGYSKIKYSNPIYIDDVAQDFPELKIVCAHFGWPWMEECLAIAFRNPNVYIDISGWKPKYLPSTLLTYINGPLQDRTLFGTDYPMLRMLSTVREVQEHLRPSLKPQVLEKLLHGNAERLLSA